MTFKDQFRFVRQNMKKTKSRVFMTVLATAMGCAFLIVLASVAFGLQRSVVRDITGDRTVTEITIFGKETGKSVTNTLKQEDLAYLRSVAHVKAVTHQWSVQQPLRAAFEGQPEPRGGPTIVLDFESESKAGMKLSAGRLPQAPNEVVVGYLFRERFMKQEQENATPQEGTPVKQQKKEDIPPASQWIGKSLTLEARQFAGQEEKKQTFTVTIVGVKEEPTREWQHDTSVYVSQGFLEQLEQFTGTMYGALRAPEGAQARPEAVKPLSGEREYNQVAVTADSLKHVKTISEEIRAKGYLNHSIANELKQVNMLFTIMKIGLIFVGTIAVLIASIGIYNTMSMAVTERAQDIGIMKAIGAHPSAIRRIFLIESSYIGLLGALIGTAVSYLISIGVNAALPVVIKNFMKENVPDHFQFSYIPLLLTALSIAISVGVAILSGSRPAARATKVDVLKALRRDI